MVLEHRGFNIGQNAGAKQILHWRKEADPGRQEGAGRQLDTGGRRSRNKPVVGEEWGKKY